MGNLALSGKVAGNANLDAQTLTVANSAVVQGELRYAAGNGTVIPTGVAASVVEEQRTQPTPAVTTGNVIGRIFGWLLRTLLVLIGYLLVGWLLWTFAPRQIAGPVVAIEHRPAEAGIIGLLAAVAVVPVGAALTFLAVLFWGWFPGGLFMLTFILGLVALLWLLSPVVSGLWVGHLIGHWFGIGEGELPRLLLGIAALVLVGRLLTLIPCIGDLTFQVLFLVSLMLTVGGWFVARRRPPQEPALLPAPVAPAVYGN
jgi:hypothetical protein